MRKVNHGEHLVEVQKEVTLEIGKSNAMQEVISIGFENGIDLMPLAYLLPLIELSTLINMIYKYHQVEDAVEAFMGWEVN